MEKDKIFFWSVLSFIVGVGWGSFFAPPASLLLLVASAVGIAIFSVFPRQEIFFLFLCLLLCCGGGYLALRERGAIALLPVLDKEVQGEARVVSDPEERDTFKRVILHFERCASKECPTTLVLWQAPLSLSLVAGTRLSLMCRLEQPKNFDDQFDYRMFLAKDRIGYVCLKAREIQVLDQDVAGRLRSWLYRPKHVLEQALSQTLTEPEAGLAKGLLLGGDNYLPRDMKETFTRIGLSHMIAVSGYNITIIAEMLLVLGLFLGLWRKQAVWTALVGIVFFIIMIGAPASAARAGAMAGIVFAAFQSGRLARPLSVLLFALGVMLFFNPLLLRYDLGFQLSFLATLGILWVAPYQERLLSKRGFLVKHLLGIILMTVAVELFVLPIILFSFHTFSLLIIIGNFLIILVPLAMALSFVAALLFLFIPGAHLFFAWLAFATLTLITRSVEGLGRMGGSVTVEHFGMLHLIVWYGVLTFGIFALAIFFPLKPYDKER